ncbi:hypothetical protein AXX12_03345 [Anaerosporomusa subterranea]|uniref:Uncharacterized protein n=1 Tax=Anaerosporomusa subterranea TaxID=1794912 RepID=A0A154BTD2_ANASB|nr:hypothetical protein [Anaerosporomusa subterranea]KYZ77181.1 hypothetical protein AXX12_03345 [Anaerosporomusa subterranea]
MGDSKKANISILLGIGTIPLVAYSNFLAYKLSKISPYLNEFYKEIWRPFLESPSPYNGWYFTYIGGMFSIIGALLGIAVLMKKATAFVKIKAVIGFLMCISAFLASLPKVHWGFLFFLAAHGPWTIKGAFNALWAPSLYLLAPFFFVQINQFIEDEEKNVYRRDGGRD